MTSKEAGNGTIPNVASLGTFVLNNAYPRAKKDKVSVRKRLLYVTEETGQSKRGTCGKPFLDAFWLPRRPLALGICRQGRIRELSLGNTSRNVQVAILRWWQTRTLKSSGRPLPWLWAVIHPGRCPNSLYWVQEELIYVSSRYARENSNWSKIKYS